MRPVTEDAQSRCRGADNDADAKVQTMTETTRRRFLQYGVATGTVLAIPAARRGIAAAVTDRRPRLAGGLRKFREPLPLPGNGIVVATPSGANRYSFIQREIQRTLHPDLPPTPV
jgi:hypothetical protein